MDHPRVRALRTGVLFEKENRERSGSSTLPQPPNITMNLTAASLRSAPAGYRERSADESPQESRESER